MQKVVKRRPVDAHLKIIRLWISSIFMVQYMRHLNIL